MASITVQHLFQILYSFWFKVPKMGILVVWFLLDDTSGDIFYVFRSPLPHFKVFLTILTAIVLSKCN